MNDYHDDGLQPAKHDLPIPNELKHGAMKYRAIVFMAFLTLSVIFSLGSLSIWHGKLISRGETSIEAHINRSETQRLAKLNKTYVNPYNFGKWKNWRLFLGLVKGR